MLKTISSITNAIGALNYKGTWNASTNTPTLASGVGTKGDYYVVSVAGSTNLDGETLWGVGDWTVFNGSVWQKVDGGSTINATTVTASTSVTTPIIQALNSAGGALRNTAGTNQLQWGAGGGDNVSLDVATTINPANAAVAISPTGTGTVTINPATISSMNNVAIGASTAAAGTFTNLAYTGTLTGGTGEVNIGLGQVYKDAGGNFGVGTTSPQAKFSVSNSGAAGFEFFVNYPGGGVGTYIQSYNRSGAAYVNTAYDALSHSFRTSSSERVLIDSSGIVTMSAYGAGAATFSAAGVISSVSDETWKIKDGVPVDPDSMLKKLEPGYWYYNDEKKEIFGVDRQLGFYAQNVNAAIGPEAAPQPEVVTTQDKDGKNISTTKPWGYYDRSVLAITVMSLQKALATIESLTARIETLEAK